MRLKAAGVTPRVLTDVNDKAAARDMCAGADTLLHLAYKVSVGGGAQLLEDMRRTNVAGTVELLRAAAAAGLRRAVVVGSALAVGVNRQPAPLDERADWSAHAFELPYAIVRRDAEIAALAEARPGFEVVSVCPAFTFGPDDPVGAPANKLLEKLATGKQRFMLPVGFACTDVRDFADGMVRAAERGRSGERYLLTGDNVTAVQLAQRVAAITGVPPPRFTPPTFLLRAAVGVLGVVSRVRRKPPPVTQEVLDVIGRYAWYDASKARTELGWSSRPLDRTLADTLEWLRQRPAT
jgi:dihydroflavonol-4-reductase